MTKAKNRTKSVTLTLQDVITASNHVRKQHDIFNATLKDLARSFLLYIIKSEDESIDFKNLRNRYLPYINQREINSVPKTEGDFYAFICRKYLHLEVNKSRNETFKIIGQVTRDLQEIQHDRQRYQEELTRLKERMKTKLMDGDNYQVKLLTHYIRKQDVAEAQVNSFIRERLKTYTAKNRYFALFNANSNFLYGYHISKSSYKKEMLSEIMNKVLHVSVKRYFQLETLYRTDKSSFLTEVAKDINVDTVMAEILKISTQHHLIHERNSLIADILALYKNIKYELFCNITPQLIEGLLYDYCLENGIAESSLVNSTLVEKIDLLKAKEDYKIQLSYEYFTFVFPVIRNKVAHGKKLADDLEVLAWTLLLDLQYVINLLTGSNLPTNQKIQSIRNAMKSDGLSHLIKLGDVLQNPLPAFYANEVSNLTALRQKLEKQLTKKNFTEQVNFSETKEREKLRQNLVQLKKLDINKSECTEILKLLNE